MSTSTRFLTAALLAISFCLIFGNAVATEETGQCGPDLYYSLDNGILTISGKGVMYDYRIEQNDNPYNDYYFTSAPWGRSLRIGQNYVIIEEGVSSIGHNAFAYCQGIVSVTLGNNVSIIGENAFKECNKLTSLSFSESMQRIEAGAFSGCSKLTSLYFPTSLTSIGQDSFSNCSSLTSVYIPNSITSIGEAAFSGSLSEIIVSPSNGYYSSIDGVLYNFNQTELLFCPQKKSGTFSVPSTVVTIGNHAFARCSNLSEVILPESVTSIGVGAFLDCSKLRTVKLPENITMIRSYAFWGCAALEAIDIPSSVSLIDTCAFLDCYSLISVVLREGVNSIGSGAFGGCQSLATIKIPESVSSIAGNPFYYRTSIVCNSCESFVYSWAKQKGISVSALKHMDVIEAEQVPPTCTEPGMSNGKQCLVCGSVLEAQVIIPPLGHIEVIEEEVSASCFQTGLTMGKYCSVCGKILIPREEIPAIGHHTIVIDEAVASSYIEDGFTEGSHCSVCGEVFVAQKVIPALATHVVFLPTDVRVIEEESFLGSSIEAVVISEGCESIGNRAFADCSRLIYIQLPSTIKNIAADAFEGDAQVFIDYFGD